MLKLLSDPFVYVCEFYLEHVAQVAAPPFISLVLLSDMEMGTNSICNKFLHLSHERREWRDE